MRFLKLTNLVFPPLCVVCGEELLSSERLCAACWPSVHFTGPSNCHKCGDWLVGVAEEGSLCDSCLRSEPPWSKGTAAVLYRDAGRELVLQFKHRDRLDLLGPLSEWMLAALNRMNLENPILVPVPLHKTRLWKRRYNQSALLTKSISKFGDVSWDGHALVRAKPTPPLGNSSAEQRADILTGSMRFLPKSGTIFEGKDIVLVDDVMASGATFREATRALGQASAASINVLALARASNSA